ncbi:MAG: outer membrane protein transport protein [Desulfuromonadales bacterium]
MVLGLASTGFSSGFAIIEQSVSGLGGAFSGGAASAEDASTIFFNPAGMTLLEGQQVVAGAHVIVPSAEFEAETAENAIAGTPLADVPGANTSLGTNNGGDGGVTAVVPNFYYSNKVNDKLSFGLGVNAPFGLTTEYDKDWVGRYHAVDSEVMTLNINPAVAYRVNEQLSVAAGVSIQYIDVTLSSMVDGGLGVFEATGDTNLLPLASNTDYDVFVENKADDVGYGFNLGLLYEFSQDTRMGFSYRSEIEHTVEGDVNTTVPDTLIPFGGETLFPDQGVNGDITLPAVASLSVYHELSDKLALMADLSWTGWSSFDKLTINFEGAGLAGRDSSTTTENWDDTWRYSAGAAYQATEALLLRTGVAFDETPISDEYRTPRIPGEDRTWVTVGAGYQLSESLTLDCAYAHIFVSDSKMEKDASDPEDAARGTVVGEFENSVDIASVQLAYSF